MTHAMKRAPTTSESASRSSGNIEEKRADDDSDPDSRAQTSVKSELVLESGLDLTNCNCSALREERCRVQRVLGAASALGLDHRFLECIDGMLRYEMLPIELNIPQDVCVRGTA